LAATASSRVISCTAWRRPDELAAELKTLLAHAPPCDHVAVTMTGELADCFQTKAEGVRRILEAVEQAVDGRATRVYSSSGDFVTTGAARLRSTDVAAANWHAVAKFAGRFARSGPALLVDLGSTTCDVIPLRNGAPAASGASDTARLLAGELVYAGVSRTPVCGLVSHLPWQGALCPVAREWFATTRDVYLLTGDVPEDRSDTETADGRPAVIDAARNRLARMICADSTSFSLEDARVAAQAIAARHAEHVAAGIRQVVARSGQRLTAVVVSGEGEFLAARAVGLVLPDTRIVSLKSHLGEGVSRCAPAHAVAVLAAEETIA